MPKMNGRTKGLLATSVAAALGGASGAADAAVYAATLSQVVSYSNNGSSAGNLTSSTATFSYDDVTNLLTQTGGTFNIRFTTSPVSTLFRQSITGLVIGNGAPAAASTYACTEGNFGGNVGASICGNYNFGANAINDSTATWGPGVTFGRTIDGDDMVLGQQQNLAAYDGFNTVSFDPATGLVLSNGTCTGSCGTQPGGTFNGGFRWTLGIVAPVQPVAVNDSAQAKSGVPTDLDVLANDLGFANPVTVSVLTPPSHGAATVLNSPGSGSDIRIRYQPTGSYTGPDSLVYQVTDGVNTATATVNITVVSFSAKDDTYVALRNSDINFFVASNDVGFGPQLNLSITQYPTLGSAHIDGSYCGPTCVSVHYFPNTYNAPAEYTDTLVYEISDGVHSDRATVTIRVVPYVALDDTAVTGSGQPIIIQVGANDLGFNYPRNVGIFTNPRHGTVTVVPPDYYYALGAVTYTPEPGFLGTDTFEYAIDDGAQIGTATVSVSVFLDADGDQVSDTVDNCLGAANASQRDTDGDGYGNWCDADFDNDGRTNFADLAAFRQRFGTPDPHSDLDGNGLVNFADLARFKALFGTGPGPSATKP